MISGLLCCPSSPVMVNVLSHLGAFTCAHPVPRKLLHALAYKSPISLSASGSDCHLHQGLPRHSWSVSSDSPHGLISFVLITLYSSIFVYLSLILMQPWVRPKPRQDLTNSSINAYLTKMLFWITVMFMSPPPPPAHWSYMTCLCCTLSELTKDKQKNRLLLCLLFSISIIPSKQTLAVSSTLSCILSVSSNSLDVSLWKRTIWSDNLIRCWQARNKFHYWSLRKRDWAPGC